MVQTHRWNHATGADAVVEARPALVVGILSFLQHVLVASVVGFFVGHPAAALHFYGVTAVEVVLHLGTVTAALIVAALEVSALVENDLGGQTIRGQNPMIHFDGVCKVNAHT